MKQKPARNVLGIIALATAALGFVFACIPGALIVGWILLPVGFILGIISLFLKDKAKWQGLTAIIVSVIGTIVGFIVFFAVVATSFSNAFQSEVNVSSGDDTAVVEEEGTADEAAPEVGTRENPAPLGSAVEGEDWTVVINSVTLGATDQILGANQFNEAPDAGTEYILINYTVTYTGEDAEGGMPVMVGVEYVTAAGVTVDSLEKMLVGPDEMDAMSTLYTDASATGNEALQVPTPADGVLAVRPGMFADTVFVAIK
nr:hypothetical protein GCM10025699_35820 [Microbacterium flavescens]